MWSLYLCMPNRNSLVAQGKEMKEPKEVSTSICAEHVHCK